MLLVVRAASVFVCVGMFLSPSLLSSANAATEAFPQSFRTEDVKAGDAVIHVRVGGHGPAVVMLHGFGDSGDMWAPLATEMAKDHTVVVPDLRGMAFRRTPRAVTTKGRKQTMSPPFSTNSTSGAPIL